MRLISKKSVLRILQEEPSYYDTQNAITEIYDKINELPTTEERKTGKWKTNSDFPDRLICSECSAQFDMWHWEAEQMHYCPNCGAKKEGAAE